MCVCVSRLRSPLRPSAALALEYLAGAQAPVVRMFKDKTRKSVLDVKKSTASMSKSRRRRKKTRGRKKFDFGIVDAKPEAAGTLFKRGSATKKEEAEAKQGQSYSDSS